MPSRSPRYIANGTIQPSRFVKIDSTATKTHSVIQNTAATDKTVGVSQEGSYDPPGVTGSATDAARSGMTLTVYGPGEECLIELGGTVTQGDCLKSDASGKATAVSFAETANTFVGGFAMENGVSGDKIRMLVNIFSIRPA